MWVFLLTRAACPVAALPCVLRLRSLLELYLTLIRFGLYDKAAASVIFRMLLWRAFNKT